MDEMQPYFLHDFAIIESSVLPCVYADSQEVQFKILK